MHGKSLKLATVSDYNRHVGKWTNLTAWSWKWTRKKILFCLLDFTILSHFIIHASCISILSHWLFRLTMVRVLTEEKKSVPWTQTTRQERQTPSTSQLKSHYARSTLAFEVKTIWRCVCHSKTNNSKTQVSRMQIRVVYLPMFWGISHQTAFLRTNWH